MESPVSRIEFRRIRLLQCWLLTSQCSDCKLVLPIELSPWQHPTDALGALACCLSGYPWHGWLSGLSGGQSCFTCAPTSHHPRSPQLFENSTSSKCHVEKAFQSSFDIPDRFEIPRSFWLPPPSLRQNRLVPQDAVDPLFECVFRNEGVHATHKNFQVLVGVALPTRPEQCLD